MTGTRVHGQLAGQAHGGAEHGKAVGPLDAATSPSTDRGRRHHRRLVSGRQEIPRQVPHLGLDPAKLKAIVVKSTNHFRAGFDGIAAETLYLDTPGAIAPTR